MPPEGAAPAGAEKAEPAAVKEAAKATEPVEEKKDADAAGDGAGDKPAEDEPTKEEPAPQDDAGK
jgi:hypothetical protein